MLATLLDKCLKKLLDQLQSLMTAGRRTDWLAICFALSLVFFAAESMQVDVHLRSPNADAACESMEMRSIFVLVDLFLAMTSGFEPLSLDWSRPENAVLLEGDNKAVDFFRGLQEISQDYCECIVAFAFVWLTTLLRGFSG